MGPITKKTSTDSNIDRKKKLEKALREGRADAKHEFEQQRDEVFQTLSASYQQMFGQIIFAKWKKGYLPALVLSPYSVPPGPVRTMWMEKFEKVTYCDDCATSKSSTVLILLISNFSITHVYNHKYFS